MYKGHMYNVQFMYKGQKIAQIGRFFVIYLQKYGA
jgi:hypothetical protein